jgi:hypothetical protein
MFSKVFANQQTVAYTVRGITWKPGEQLLLRWDDADETGNDDIMGLDNFSFSANLSSAVPTTVSTGAFSVTTHSAELAGMVNDNYEITTVSFEYDTSVQFTHPQNIPAIPATLPAGSGNTAVGAVPAALIPGRVYYFRVKAENILGTALSASKSFTTTLTPPQVTTHAATAVATSTATLGGNVIAAAGETISERGIVWALTANPGLLNNKIVTGSGAGIFPYPVTGLPQGSIVYARAYAINAGGTAYGDEIKFLTHTIITSLQTTATGKTNAATVVFSFRTAQPVSGLTAANFSVLQTGITGAFITGITVASGSFTVTVSTGSGAGILGLRFVDDNGLSVPINNKPFTAANIYNIDKQPPQVKSISIPDAQIKVGDTITVGIAVFPDADVYKMVAGNINGYPLAGLVRKNDSLYTAYFIVTNGGNDIAASADIPFMISMADSLSNTAIFQSAISQSSDAMDANKPFIISIENPPKGIYKTGDTLDFKLAFNEKIFVSSGIPSISLTIGTRSRTAVYIAGNGTDSLLFRHIITADDLDMDGIKTGTVVVLNNAVIKDLAGNTALLQFANPLQTNDVRIDAVLPVISNVQVPANKTYRAGDTLHFVLSFSKPVLLTTNSDTPSIRLTIGSTERKLYYANTVSNNALAFRYIIKYGDLDKTGIGIGSLVTLNNCTLTDSLGNIAVTSFKTGSLSGIRIDAVAPVFTIAGYEMIQLCENANTITIGNAFSVTDEEAGELVSWRLSHTGKFGAVSLQSYGATSNGKNIIPSGINYKPYENQNGIDTIITEITDGVNTSQKLIILHILPSLQNNTVTGQQVICGEKKPDMLRGSDPLGGNGIYRYIWEIASVADSSRFTVLTGADQQQYSPALLQGNSWFRRRILSGTCTDTSAAIKITVIKTGFWTGSANSDWHNTANWCSGTIPDAATAVLIYPGTKYEPIITNTALCNDLLLFESAMLTIEGTLEIAGKLNANEGSVRSGNGTILCNGDQKQSVNGKFFQNRLLKNFIVSNTGGVEITDHLELSGNLFLLKGMLKTNDYLTLDHTAMIGPSANGTSINGNISMRHLVKGGKSSFHLLGHPFMQDLSLQMLRDSVDITGENGALNGFTTTTINDPSAFMYDPFKGNDSTGIDAGWFPFINTKGSEGNTWKKHRGIRLLVRGKPGQGLDGSAPGDGKNGTYLPLPVTLKLSGAINMGEQEVFLQKSTYAGYNIISNPYPSAIDLSRVTKGNDVGNYYWLWNPHQGRNGGYTSYLFRAEQVLSPFGALVAKATGTANSSLLFTEHCKTNQSFSDSITVTKLDDVFYVELRLETDTIFWDRLLLLQMDSARTGIDKNDAEKFQNPGTNFYSLSRELKKLSADARPINNESTIALGIQTNELNVFTIRVAKADLPLDNTLMLHDKLLNKWISLATDSSYRFITTNDSTSTGDKRFEITSPKKPVDSSVFLAGLILKVSPVPARNTVTVHYLAVEPGNTTVRLSTLTGNTVKQMQLGTQKEGRVNISIEDLPAGIYVIEVRCGIYRKSKKIIRV